MRRLIAIICFILCVLSLSAVQFKVRDIPPTIVDTLFLVREDCVSAAVFIAPYGNPNNTYYQFSNPTPSSGTVTIGDGYSFDQACNRSNRVYFSFPMQDGHEDYTLLSVDLLTYQINSFGNELINTFPLWFGGEQHFLLAAHVNFIQPLTEGSFNPAFCQNMGTLSSDEAVGWKSMDVTGHYIYAKEHQNWSSFQVMLYFDILTDWDNNYDSVLIGSGSFQVRAPKLVLTYQHQSATEDETQVSQIPKVNIYPNPTKTITTIKADIGYRITNATLYNLKGQKVNCENLLISKSPNELLLNTESLPSGVYIIKSKLSNGTDQKELCNKLLIY
ncbi:MAG: hypothetical protein CVU50_02640 [Candidatus Cloacimonetes bacterium HGW-Cloacimonetes-3]|jgi:hypothetical protein|nr:MAG: hypothetical protein CVU50_02640 [Candidatus Cloacimonetes bacterium HGW-Cloacimonetes-3]